MRKNNGEKQADIAILKSPLYLQLCVCTSVQFAETDRPLCFIAVSHRYYRLLVSARFSSTASHL